MLTPDSRSASQLVSGALHAVPTPVEDVGVDHRRGDIAVPKQLLHRPDVVSGFEQMRRKAVSFDTLRYSG